MDFALARKRLGYTQAQLAKEIDVHQSTVALWEKGKTRPSVKKVLRAAEVYGVSVEELLSTEGSNST